MLQVHRVDLATEQQQMEEGGGGGARLSEDEA